MNIVQYSPYALADDTGTGNAMLGWCEALARQGSNVTLLVDGDLISRPAPQGVLSVPVKHRLRGRMRVPTGVRGHLSTADLFVVHGGFTLWNIAACRAAAASNVPYLVVPQGAYNERSLEHRRAIKWLWTVTLERRHLRNALGAHLLHESELAGLKRLHVDIPLVIAPNGISVPEGFRWDGGSGGYLLYLGRYDVHVKALDLLIESFTHIPEPARPTLRLHGRDHRGGKLRVDTRVRELGLEPWIIVGGPIYGDEKRDALTRASGCVYPSRWDAWPMAVIEAVGAGVPTLVTDYPLGRLLEEEGAALQCERSPEGIARGIGRLLSEEGRKVAQRGTDLAKERLSWDLLASSWLEQVARLLTPLLSDSPPGRGSVGEVDRRDESG